MGFNNHGMPIYLEIHRGHRSGKMNFGVMTGLIEDLSIEDIADLRETICVVVGLCEEAIRRGMDKRYPAAQKEAQ